METEVWRLHEELVSGVYRPGCYTYFKIYEPKERVVAAAPFRDRVVHHALVRVLQPIFEPRFIEDSFACRPGKGTHAGMRRAAEFARRFPYVLKCDIKRYFPNIDHKILLAAIERVVADQQVLDLIRRILASHRNGFRRAYGESLFDTEEISVGLPIGNLTSQFFANIHLDGFDHFVKQDLRIKGYVRYVDDFLIFAPDRRTARLFGAATREYLRRLRLEIHPDKYRLCSSAGGVDFCGFVVRSDGRIRVRRESVRRFQRKLLHRKWQWKSGKCEASDVQATVQAWIGHVSHAQSWRLRSKVFAS
ncbi:MAG: reverse transcriptase/maturase family protein [Terrimicrobiaceae bacterium]